MGGSAKWKSSDLHSKIIKNFKIAINEEWNPFAFISYSIALEFFQRAVCPLLYSVYWLLSLNLVGLCKTALTNRLWQKWLCQFLSPYLQRDGGFHFLCPETLETLSCHVRRSITSAKTTRLVSLCVGIPGNSCTAFQPRHVKWSHLGLFRLAYLPTGYY